MSNPPIDRFSIKILKSAFVPAVPCWNYKLASIPTWRFYWNMSGGACIYCRGEKIELTPDIAVLIPPQTPFSTASSRPFVHFFIHFSLPENISSRRIIHKLDVRSVISGAIAENLPRYSALQLQLAASAVVNTALLALPEKLWLQEKSENNVSVFNQAVNFIENNPGKYYTCDELAKLCGTSINTLQRQFLKATGLSVKKWILNKKMETAVQLMLHDCETIKEVADKLGFADRYHFSKVFKQYFGIAPGHFVRSGGIPLP